LRNEGKSSVLFNPDKTYGTLIDQDGYVYKTTKIGSQTWMAENLRTTKYRDGSTIPYVTANAAWAALNSGAYCNYKNTINNDTIATFGRLYNYFAVIDSRNLSPIGWHVPTDDEWTILTEYLGGESVAGGKLKELNISHWINPNSEAENSSGFTALPGGYRYHSGIYLNDGSDCYYWSFTESSNIFAWYRYLNNYEGYIHRYGSSTKSYGFSVRCVKD
jgi:uncharacterized protein (TIGR02145 family)